MSFVNSEGISDLIVNKKPSYMIKEEAVKKGMIPPATRCSFKGIKRIDHLIGDSQGNRSYQEKALRKKGFKQI